MGNQLGRRIRALRQRAELSVTALAGDELSVATVSRIEHGGMEPSLGTLRYLAGRLDCTVADLLVEDDNALAIHAALEEIEAWFLLARPDRALDRSLAALEACAEVAGDVGLPPHQATLQRRLRGALLRSRTLLDPSAAPELDTAISQARRLGDIWLVARLCAVRAPTLEPE
ncbi:MAG TPA: helix-turn-helix transcriptional regulator, partial [Chloroflexota bacterium]